MRDDARPVTPYERPSIEERTPIDVPLIGRISTIAASSAVFRTDQIDEA
jgi:hypothetical protein